jgi:hypothetical protein
VRLRFAQLKSRATAKLFVVSLLCAGVATFANSSLLRAQNPDTLMPEQSNAKGRQILDQLITGLGGPTYLDVKDSDCEGRLARFGHNGEMTGYTNFKDIRKKASSSTSMQATKAGRSIKAASRS